MSFFKFISLLLFSKAIFAHGYTYECRKDFGHVIHIITIDPQKYTSYFVKAKTALFGRETIDSIAERFSAPIAINGGFFEIGGNQDGLTSGTMIVDGKILGLKFVEQTCFIQDETGLSIQQFTPRVTFGNVHIQKMNKPAGKSDIVLYSDTWGKTTLTGFSKRKEFAIDSSGKIISVFDHGNIEIPENGFVVSFPKTSSVVMDPSATLIFNPLIISKKNISMLMGIPMLVENKSIKPAIMEGKSNFFTSSLARSAIGLKPTGEIVLVVAEHSYTKPLKDATFGEAKSIITDNKFKLMAKYLKTDLKQLTLGELQEIIQEELSNKKASTGLSLPELAQLMLDLGCQSAMNLDGGGSSSLFLEDKIINQTIGDQDESMGQNIARPVSDAIVFIPQVPKSLP